MGTGERERAVGEGCGESGRRGSEGGEIAGMKADDKVVGNDCPGAVADPIALHRSLEPAQNLDRPDCRSEQQRGLALEEPFEEALDGGKGSHVGGGV